MIVAIYLAAIATANLAAARYGPAATIVIAFLFIGLDMACRDALQERWAGRWMWPRMLGLIVAGGLVSFIVNRDAAVIAVASTVAFVASTAVDALVFAALGDRDRLVKWNGSNLVSAAVDSLLFPTIAFGSLLPLVVVGQYVAKVGGGLVWSLALNAVSVRRREA